MGPSETMDYSPWCWMTKYWLIPKTAKATFGNGREMTTLGFAWIQEFIGAGDIFVFLVN